MIGYQDLDVAWLGYATVRIAGSSTVYTDPGRYGVLTGEWPDPVDVPAGGHPRGDPYGAEDGDVVVVTHDHHYDPDGIERVATTDATLVVYEAVDVDRIRSRGRDLPAPESLPYDVVRVAYGDAVTVAGIEIEVLPAYNHDDGSNVRDGEPIHPEGFGCGYLLRVDGVPCLWPGDTDVLDGHRDLDPSLFLPPIGRSFTMDRHAAAGLAEDVAPGLVLPIHYNTFEALAADAAAFAADVAGRGIPVVLDEQGHP